MSTPEEQDLSPEERELAVDLGIIEIHLSRGDRAKALNALRHFGQQQYSKGFDAGDEYRRQDLE